MERLNENDETITNPWRRFTLIFLLLVALATIFNVYHDSDLLNSLSASEHMWVNWGLSVLWFLIGILLIRHLSRVITYLAGRQGKYDARVTMLANRSLSAVGYLFVLVVGLHLLHVKVGSILVGGAVTGVIVGIGAQSTLSNFFAGLILFTLRPFSVGQTIMARTYLFGGIEYSGVVHDINWYHTVLTDGVQKRIIPNSSMIISAITIVSETNTQIHSIPLPYTVPMHEFEEEIRTASQDQATVVLREFGEKTYTVELKMPVGIDADVIRTVIAKHCS
ncbi:mechanosensitive ion channel family protein [Alicyclobacillus dauci]|uniref:Mechanosensitive ion channel n=1 Tax=Alicyclobacillus dauci TaxID=1475485 RepID=A0ABY6Z7W0_9BACL|nr:mechanosensitive ion channel domain-containing protein [Alicyclobacillus dauci]WAH38677.1 mechanosensitive ion channel [Alicyclobacillus dauci]